MKKFFGVCGIIAVFSFMIPSAQSATELSFQSMYAPAQTQYSQILVPWAKSFAQESDGKLVMHPFSLGGVVGSGEVRHAVHDGMLDTGTWASSAFPKEHPYVYLFSLPYLVKNATEGTKLAYKLYDDVPKFKENINDAGILLAMWGIAPYALASKTPIHSIKDIQGKRVLIFSGADANTVEAWGAIPVRVAASDVYVGLQRGMGDALFCAIPWQKGARIYEVVKNFTPMPAASAIHITSMNRETFEELTEDEQKLIMKLSGPQLGLKIAESLDRDVSAAFELFKKEGAQIITLQPDAQKEFETLLKKTNETYWERTLKELGVKEDTKNLINSYYKLASEISTK